MLKKKKEIKKKDHQPAIEQPQAESRLRKKKMMVQEKPKYNNPKRWLLQEEEDEVQPCVYLNAKYISTHYQFYGNRLEAISPGSRSNEKTCISPRWGNAGFFMAQPPYRRQLSERMVLRNARKDSPRSMAFPSGFGTGARCFDGRKRGERWRVIHPASSPQGLYKRFPEAEEHGQPDQTFNQKK